MQLLRGMPNSRCVFSHMLAEKTSVITVLKEHPHDLKKKNSIQSTYFEVKKPFGWELKHLQTGQKSSCFGLKHFSFLLIVWSIIINVNYFRIQIDSVVEDLSTLDNLNEKPQPLIGKERHILRTRETASFSTDCTLARCLRRETAERVYSKAESSLNCGFLNWENISIHRLVCVHVLFLNWLWTPSDLVSPLTTEPPDSASLSK